MAAPSTAIQRLDLSLTHAEFNLRANRAGYVGLQVLPAVLVAAQSATFMKVPVEALLTKIESTERAPKGAYARGDFEWEQASYATVENGVEEVVDDRELAIYGREMRVEQVCVQRGLNRLLQAFEQKVSDAVFNTTTWAGSALTTAVSTPWSTAASATPTADIDAAMEKVESGCGTRPNAILLTHAALRKWARTDDVKDQFKAQFGNDAPMGAIVNALKGIHEFEHVFVADGFKNTGALGQTAAFSRLWDTTKAMVFYHSPNGPMLEDPMPCLGKTIMFGDEIRQLPGADDGESSVIVEEYREEGRRGGVMRFRFDYQVKILRPEAGHLLTSVIA